MDKVSKWYAIYTKPRWERKVSDVLARSGFESYCPMNKVMHQWSDRKKFVLEPLFKSYIFIHISESEQYKVKGVSGVLYFVNFMGRPAVVRSEAIDTIKGFLQEYGTVRLEKNDIKINDTVVIRSGPFGFQKASVMEVRHKVIRVILPSLGYRMIAEIERTNAELLTEDSGMMGKANNQ